jgi:septal ring factor EnvC (AmiA/AmiB activator)
MSDNTEKDEVTTKTDTAAREDIPQEVFDSSTYNSMTDLKTSAAMDEDEANKVLSDTENKEPIEPENAPTGSTTNANVSPTVTPTMEGRPSALKKSKGSQSISKQLDKQTTKINKNMMQMFQPLQKHIKSADKQSELIKQLQSQLKQLQKEVSQIQRAVSTGKKKKKASS